MNRGILIVLAILAVAPAHAQDEAKKATTGSKPAQTAKQPKKAGPAGKKDALKKPEAGGSAAWGGTGGTTKGSASSSKGTTTAAPKHAAERAAMLRVRSTYRYAVESCEEGKGCDPALRDDAANHFIDSCLPCATREQCEAERDAIRAGTSKSMTTLCSD